MRARYPGTCRGCGQRFAKGTEIVYLGRGRTYHPECDEPRGPVDDTPGALRSYYDRRGVYLADGTCIGTTGPRCEDAPCCGCCS